MPVIQINSLMTDVKRRLREAQCAIRTPVDYGYAIAIIPSMKVSVAEAKNTLTRLIQRVEEGERVTICRHGVPVADLVRTAATERRPRRFGTLKNKIKILDSDWARPQHNIEAWLRGDV
jgi:prevent-host-death family protein